MSLFDALCAQLHVEPDGRGEVWVDCPWCGKGRKHFSFSEKHGYNCFSCGEKGKSLSAIAEQLNIRLNDDRRPTTNTRRPTKPQAPREWQQRPEFYLDRFCGALDRVTRWQGYKPLSLDSISRFRLGVGVLPASRCEHRRLIVPVFDARGRCVALHGRAYLREDTEAKWLSAGGSDKRVLFLVGTLEPGCTVVVCENYADAIFAYQVEPSCCYIPLGGLGWQDAWTVELAASRPAQVLIWLDHDLAGNGSRYHHRELLALWRQGIEARRAADPALAARPFPRPPEPRGPKIANLLLAAGLKARCHEWRRSDPLKADLGWALMQELQAA